MRKPNKDLVRAAAGLAALFVTLGLAWQPTATAADARSGQGAKSDDEPLLNKYFNRGPNRTSRTASPGPQRPARQEQAAPAAASAAAPASPPETPPQSVAPPAPPPEDPELKRTEPPAPKEARPTPAPPNALPVDLPPKRPAGAEDKSARDPGFSMSEEKDPPSEDADAALRTDRARDLPVPIKPLGQQNTPESQAIPGVPVVTGAEANVPPVATQPPVVVTPPVEQPVVVTPPVEQPVVVTPPVEPQEAAAPPVVEPAMTFAIANPYQDGLPDDVAVRNRRLTGLGKSGMPPAVEPAPPTEPPAAKLAEQPVPKLDEQPAPELAEDTAVAAAASVKTEVRNPYESGLPADGGPRARVQRARVSQATTPDNRLPQQDQAAVYVNPYVTSSRAPGAAAEIDRKAVSKTADAQNDLSTFRQASAVEASPAARSSAVAQPVAQLPLERRRIIRTVYRVDGGAMPGAADGPMGTPAGMIPSQPGLPADVRGAGMEPLWPQQNPATFSQPQRTSGTAGASPISPGVDAGPASVCEGTQILGRVGADVILMSEITPTINEIFSLNKDKLPKDPADIEKAREQMARQLLESKIEFKLICQDARRKIPKEGWQRMEKAMNERFTRVEIDRMMKQMNVSSRDQLDKKLREMGSSVERMRQSFVERMVAQQWLHEQIKADEDVRPEEMLAYYQMHIADFETPAQARWEELVVRLDRHSDRNEAYALIAELGNQVFSGVPLAEVAKQRSEGPTASGGGQREWASQGSLVSQKLDQALFALPIGAMSQILEDNNVLSVVRVLERRDKVRTPFAVAQLKIRDKLKDERKKIQMQQYVAKLRKQIPVWTIYGTETAKRDAGGTYR